MPGRGQDLCEVPQDGRRGTEGHPKAAGRACTSLAASGGLQLAAAPSAEHRCQHLQVLVRGQSPIHVQPHRDRRMPVKQTHDIQQMWPRQRILGPKNQALLRRLLTSSLRGKLGLSYDGLSVSDLLWSKWASLAEVQGGSAEGPGNHAEGRSRAAPLWIGVHPSERLLLEPASPVDPADNKDEHRRGRANGDPIQHTPIVWPLVRALHVLRLGYT
mmetsp:Transcript_16340/g.57082  ORF Transcript_16340/g.57082 Transcript_16340/m.57082 type:complete len:215 (+) Transcript_16340:977-1621(+)